MQDFIDVLMCSEPGKLEIMQLPAPKPEPGHALVRPLRVGLCGTDYHIFEGSHPFLDYPRVMGHELAVEVIGAPHGSPVGTGDVCVVNPYISCGRCVACRKGKPNCCVNIAVLGVHRDGGMAGLLSLPAANLVRADGLSADACAVVEFLAIGAHAVRRGAISAQDSVLVVGAGPIGLGVALFARLAGARVAVLDRDPERVATATALVGAVPLPAGASVAESVRDFTMGDGFDAVFDATGSAQSMQTSFEFVAHGGRYVLVGVVKDQIGFADPLFHGREMTLLATRNATAQDFERVIAAIRSGDVPVDRLITHRTSLAGAVDDIPLWARQKSGLVKAVIDLA